MSLIYNDGTTLHGTNLERPRTDVRTVGTIGAANGEVVLDLNGESTVTVDMRASAVSATFQIEGTIDGTTYFVLPFYNPLTELWVTIFTAAGQWVVPNISAFRKIRVRCSAYTSGAATVTINASIGRSVMYSKLFPSALTLTATGIAGAAVTLTITSGGAGLYHYITQLIIDRVATAALVAAATPVIVTTTNITGSLAFSIPANAANQGDIYTKELCPSRPLKSTTAATNTTIVCPATTNTIWRVTALYYVGA